MISLCVFSFISNKAKSSADKIMTLLDGGEGSEITVLRRGVPANVNGIP